MTEAQIQQQIYIYFNNNYCLKTHNPRGICFAVPNGGTRNIREAVALKNTGLLSGVSDMIFIMPNGKILFIEVKIDNGRQSDTQIDFQNRIEALGHDYFICRSLEQFKFIISGYL